MKGLVWAKLGLLSVGIDLGREKKTVSQDEMHYSSDKNSCSEMQFTTARPC